LGELSLSECEGTVTPSRGRRRNKGRVDFIAGVVGNLITLVLLKYLPVLFPAFFSEGFDGLRVIAGGVLISQTFAYLVLLVYAPKWFYRLIYSAINALSLISLIALIALFPFNMPAWLGVVIRAGLSIGAAVTAITVPAFLVGGIAAIFEQQRS
jgi:hypothetical protein